MNIIATIKEHPISLIVYSLCGALVFFSAVVPFLTGKDSLPELMNGRIEESSMSDVEIPDKGLNVDKTELLEGKYVSGPKIVENVKTIPLPVAHKKLDENGKEEKIKNSANQIIANSIECVGNLDNHLDCKL